MGIVTGEKIGQTYKFSRGETAVVGQIDYDWAFDIPHWWNLQSQYTQFGVGYVDINTQQYQTLNGAWGAWNNNTQLPNVVDISVYGASANNWSVIQNQWGIMWNAIDDVLVQGSAGGAFSQYQTVQEKVAALNSLLDDLDTYGSWLWGNSRDGGCCFFKYDSTHVMIFGTYGYYKNAEGHVKVAATVGNQTPAISELREGILAVYYYRNAGTFDNHITFVTARNNGSAYVISSPEQTLGNIDWYGSNRDLGATLDNSTATFGEGWVYNTLFSLNSVGSPYSWGIELYWPETVIDDPSYYLDQGGNDTGIVEVEQNGGNAGDNKGDGDFNNDSDAVPMTDESQFAVDAQGCGFVTVFKPSKSTLVDFASWLYGDLPTTLSSFLDTISKLQKNPMDAIISLNLAHYDAASGGSEPINFFGQSSGYSAPVVSKLTHVFNCGTLYINEYSGNFLDYGNCSNIKVFLPYCGTFTLATNEVMGCGLTLKYIIDVLTGACVAELKVKRSRSHVYKDPSIDATIYRFSGNIFQQIPITNVDYSSIMRGQLGLAASVASIASGNVIGGIQGAMNSAMSMSPSVERVGNLGSSYGYMSTQEPFVIQEYPWYNWPDNYTAYYGKPLYQYKTIGSCEGYVEVDTSTLWATDPGNALFIDMTEEEEAMLKAAVESGIYMPETETDYARKNYDPTA